jgi:hypothetical protein
MRSPSDRGRLCKAPSAAVAAFCLLLEAPGPAIAADEVRIELNKLEDKDGSCRIHLVLENTSSGSFEGYKLDLVLFGSDGIIARRLAVDVAPLRARKKSVKLFDVDGLACSAIGAVLLNDVLGCRSSAGEHADCVDNLVVSTRAATSFTK